MLGHIAAGISGRVQSAFSGHSAAELFPQLVDSQLLGTMPPYLDLKAR